MKCNISGCEAQALPDSTLCMGHKSDEQTGILLRDAIHNNEVLQAAEYSWRNIAQEAIVLLDETLADYEDKTPRTPADYPRVIHRMAKIRAFLRRIGKHP